jgi:hypothetical protein
LKLGPNPPDPGLEPGRVEEKIEKVMTRRPGKTRLQPVDFFFLLKRRRFDFFLK